MVIDMKVILLQDVKDLGQKDDVCEVSNGYARNFLIPKKMAAEASAKNIHGLRIKKAGEEKIAQAQLDAAEALAASLAGKQVVIPMRAGEGEKLFGSVGGKEIAQAYKEQFDLDIDRKKIQLAEAIRSFGVHQVTVRLHPQVTGELTVLVKEA